MSPTSVRLVLAIMSVAGPWRGVIRWGVDGRATGRPGEQQVNHRPGWRRRARVLARSPP
ncbi:MAG: hypothetical protein KJ792_15745 [Actinobacteria bacterium]|nr:hypothetical protein [Actinomycetota bacterium]